MTLEEIIEKSSPDEWDKVHYTLTTLALFSHELAKEVQNLQQTVEYLRYDIQRLKELE